MFIKKNYKFLLLMIIYTILSSIFIMYMFKLSSANKFRLAALILFAPVIFYYTSYQKLKDRNLFALYVILGTFHFSMFAFSIDLGRYNFLFQLVLLINLLATILSYSFIYFTINKCIEVPLYQMYGIENKSIESLKSVSNYLTNYQPKFFYAIIEVFVLGIISALLKNAFEGFLLKVLILVVLLIFSAVNIYFHSKSLLSLLINTNIKVKILSLIGLMTMFVGLQFNYEERFNVYLMLSFVVYIIFLVHFEHLKYITKELNDELGL